MQAHHQESVCRAGAGPPLDDKADTKADGNVTLPCPTPFGATGQALIRAKHASLARGKRKMFHHRAHREHRAGRGRALFLLENRPAGCLAFGDRLAIFHAALRQRRV